jgi:adenine-specific DNA-methyltransferase
MEPREAASLPVPTARALEAVWKRLRGERASLDRKLHKGLWEAVHKRVDEILLRDVLKLSSAATQEFYEAARFLRERRVGREQRESPLLTVLLP